MASCQAITANLRSLPYSSFHRSLPPLFPSNSRLVAEERRSYSRGLKSNTENFRRGRRITSTAETVAAKSRGKVNVFDSEEDLAASLAKYAAELSDRVCKGRGSFAVVISGGSLVKSLRKLTEAPYLDLVDWSKWHVFWVDERVVPKDHPESNYLLAFNEFLSKVPIPSGNIHAINDALSAEDAADDYEDCLKHLIKLKAINQPLSSDFPKFDLMLLGMGPDGHLASLFPTHPLLQENKKWVSFIKDSPKPPPERISFTLPVINSSANIALVAAGAGKAPAVHTALNGSSNSDELPVQLVAPEGMLTWFLDRGSFKIVDKQRKISIGTNSKQR